MNKKLDTLINNQIKVLDDMYMLTDLQKTFLKRAITDKMEAKIEILVHPLKTGEITVDQFISQYYQKKYDKEVLARKKRIVDAGEQENKEQ